MGLLTQITQSIRIQSKPSSFCVLVLENNPNLIYLYTQALEQAGYEVYPATTIEMARDLLSNHSFQVFISDTHLNNQDQGVGLIYEQMNLLTQKRIKTIMISSHIHYERICQEMGVDVFIEKPVAIDRLIAFVDRLVE